VVQDSERLGSLKVGLWCNWIFVALTAVGWLGIAHFYAPARADLGLYLPIVIWGAYIALTTWYMLKELKRAPDRAQNPASVSTADAG